jgi:hypothetical protein
MSSPLPAAQPAEAMRALPLRGLHLCQARFEQSTRTVSRRDPIVKTVAMYANEISDRRLEFLSTCPANPTGSKVCMRADFVLFRKFAIDGGNQFAVREMQFVGLHRFTFQSRAQS